MTSKHTWLICNALKTASPGHSAQLIKYEFICSTAFANKRKSQILSYWDSRSDSRFRAVKLLQNIILSIVL